MIDVNDKAYVKGYIASQQGLSIDDCPRAMPRMEQNGKDCEAGWAESIQYVHWWKAGYNDHKAGWPL